MKIEGLEVPGLLLDAMRDGLLPSGRIRGAVQALPQPSAGHFAETDLELIRTPDELQPGGSPIADTASLRKMADSTELAEKYKVKRGSAEASPVELPWLDVEQALVIGGGASYGDDTWVVLDYRTGANDPRVAMNVWKAGKPSEVEWRELAPSMSEFLKMLGVGEQRS
jgi:hypothetical protein